MTGVDAVRQAAVSLFARQGYAGTGIRELGRAVGLTSATLYHYAGGKEELLAGIMRDALTELLRSAHEAVTGADATVLMTEWNQYRGLNLAKLKSLMRGDVFVDLRNVYERHLMARHGFQYSCVGR